MTFTKRKQEGKRSMKYKKDIIRTIVLVIVILILRQFNILHFEHDEILILGALFVFCFFAIRKVEIITEINYKENRLNYSNLDFMRYVCAIVIIVLHLRPFLGISYEMDLAFSYIAGRICVPFFFLVSGYFVAIKEKDNPGYIKSYSKKVIPFYLVWSAFYVPFILYEHWSFISLEILTPLFALPIYLILFAVILGLLIAIVIALFYAGTYYHLWYFPAVLLSLMVLAKWKKHFSVKLLLFIALFLLLFGATETYFGILPVKLQQILQIYYNLFFTTRNFLFFGLFYVTLGYFIGSKKQAYVKHCFLKLSIWVLILIGETMFLQLTERLNSNILLSCVPLVYYLFISLIYSNTIFPFPTKYTFRDLNKYYYLLHPACILLLNVVVIEGFQLTRLNEFSFIKIGIVILFTHVLTILVIKLKRRFHLHII